MNPSRKVTMQRYHYVLYFFNRILTEVLATSEQEAREIALENYNRCPGIHPDWCAPFEYEHFIRNTRDIRRMQPAVTLCAWCGVERHQTSARPPKRETVLIGRARKEGVVLMASYSEHLHEECCGQVRKEMNLERHIMR